MSASPLADFTLKQEPSFAAPDPAPQQLSAKLCGKTLALKRSYHSSSGGARLTRVSIAIKNAEKIRPVLMHVDRENDTIASLCQRIRTKFAIKKEAHISRLLL